MKLPAKDSTKSDEEQGLYGKYHIRRVDGTDEPGGKHFMCSLFVLDATHDPHAKVALRAYAESVKETHPLLAADMIKAYEL